ncbi:hypothetical protein AUC68_09300 [Methyloceanibacter methanicus]|uniref:Reverse transcriptase domain-containing protein n=1 Tax=Methyloceanibacter methanicus TaxID=1774968 RepID=A0A1E3VZ97_9HYPH|nr:reverse transcriptase domain-containing protein [Methyloceanibacter methanicus]ODR98591.1 hypothetical protein AUC68_09300 [Methyloceanibacter methanicus]
MRENYRFSYQRKGKHIFVPNDECKRRGKDIIEFCAGIELPAYVYHYRSGGHVAALHAHRENSFFFRIDLKDFYYSIARNRVTRVLRGLRYRDARTSAEWSCVKNPYVRPSYTLPIGFVQSPILATLVTLQSPLVQAIEEAMAEGVLVSLYFDDFVGSAADKARLTSAYERILSACALANFIVNETKLAPPSDAIVAFNCNLTHQNSEVRLDRIAEFYADVRSTSSAQSFEDYCARVRS